MRRPALLCFGLLFFRLSLSVTTTAWAEPAAGLPADTTSAQTTLAGRWSIEKDSFRRTLLEGFNANGVKVDDTARQLIERIIERSDMSIEFRPDSTMKATSKIVVPGSEIAQEVKESGSWRVTGRKDQAFTVETVTKADPGAEQETEVLFIEFLTRDQIRIKIPLQKTLMVFERRPAGKASDDAP
jgi:hypothetical protein